MQLGSPFVLEWDRRLSPHVDVTMGLPIIQAGGYSRDSIQYLHNPRFNEFELLRADLRS